MVGDLLQDLVHVYVKVAVFAQAVGNRLAAHKPDQRFVNREAGIGIEHLVVALDERQNREEHDGLATRRDDDFARIDGDAEPLRDLAGNGLAQLGKPGGWAVVSPALAQSAGRCLDDVGRRREVRLADFQVDDLFAAGFQFPRADENVKGALRPQAGHAVCQSEFADTRGHDLPPGCHGSKSRVLLMGVSISLACCNVHT